MKKFTKLIALALLLFLFANAASAATAEFKNPLKFEDVKSILYSIMDYLWKTAGAIALIFIIIGGVMYMISGGNKDMMERGKKTLVYAMAGFAIVIAAPTFLNEIETILGTKNKLSEIGGLTLYQIAMNVVTLLLSVVGILGIISIVVGAVWMFSAMGDKDRYELGKKTVIYAIIGTVIVFCALVIIKEISSIVGGGVSPSGGGPTLPTTGV